MERRIVLNVLLSWLCLGLPLLVNSDLFTSIASLEGLLKMNSFAEKILQKDLDIIQKGGLTDQKSIQIQSIYDGFTHHETNVRHPIDAYHLLKRWYQLAQIYGDGEFMQEIIEVQEIPTESDLQGAAAAILRLQRTYSLNTADLAKGEVAGHKSVYPLDVDDFYRLGSVGIATEDFGLGAQWLELAVIQGKELLDKQKNEQPKGSDKTQHELNPQNPLPFNLSNAFVMLSEAHVMIGDHLSAMTALEKARETDPTNSTIMEIYDEGVEELQFSEPAKVNMNTWERQIEDAPWIFDYEKLCRGERIETLVTQQQQNASVVVPLTCRYKKSRLLPYVQYKEETLSWDPRISMFHDVIREPEIERIKLLAQPDLRRAQVAGDIQDVSDTRVSKLSWLFDYDNSAHEDADFVRGISLRVGDITDMDVTLRDVASSAEAFQVVNYGIGGQYEPHYDHLFDKDTNIVFEGSGSRIVTFMFYLSDVTEGGATVFPEVGVRVPAIKGAAAFWYNVLPTMEMDDYTLHAGCPVLIGEKWVANKWIRSNAQMFRFPCHTDPKEGWA